MAVITRVHGSGRSLAGHIYSLGAKGFVITVKGLKRLYEVGEETAQAKTDLVALYDRLVALTATVTDHAATHGSETLGPGVYTTAGAMNITGTLTLNGSPTDLFVFRCAGAFTTGASAEVILTGGAVSSNVWIVAEGAASTGASTVFRGNIMANTAAVSTGASTSIEGRMMAISGAVGIGAASIVTAPTGTSVQALGTLDSFNLFTGTGAISTTGTDTTVALGIGTNSGAITGFGTYGESTTVVDLRAEDDALDETVEQIIKEINPLMYMTTNADTGIITVVCDSSASAADLQHRIRTIGGGWTRSTGAYAVSSVGPNNIDTSGSLVTLAATLTAT